MEESNYSLYRRERENAEIVEDEYGFAAAIPFGSYWYIDEIFVKRSHRRTYKASEYADKLAEIGRKRGYTSLLGSVDVRAEGSTNSIKTLVGYGMKLHSIDGNTIYFSKKI